MMQKLFSPLAACALAAVTALCTPVVAHESIYTATLTGANEAPPNGSPGTGTARVTIDFDKAEMRVQVSFSNLASTVSASHIHCCTIVPGTGTAIVATTTPTFPGFPSGVTFGSYDHTFDLTQASSYNPAFITAQGGTVANAENALFAGLANGTAYLNIHTNLSSLGLQNNGFPAGEIRGFLALAPVPEPGTWAMMLAGLALVGVAGRRRLKAA